MQYYVLGSDGKRYGPTEVEGLKAWAIEGRVDAQTTLELEDGTQILASQVPGLLPHAVPPMQVSAPYRPDDGATELTTAWICGAVGLLVCGPIAIIGLVNANKAVIKGNAGGNAARIFNIVVLVLSGLGILCYGIFMAAAFAGALPR